MKSYLPPEMKQHLGDIELRFRRAELDWNKSISEQFDSSSAQDMDAFVLRPVLDGYEHQHMWYSSFYNLLFEEVGIANEDRLDCFGVKIADRFPARSRSKRLGENITVCTYNLGRCRNIFSSKPDTKIPDRINRFVNEIVHNNIDLIGFQELPFEAHNGSNASLLIHRLNSVGYDVYSFSHLAQNFGVKGNHEGIGFAVHASNKISSISIIPLPQVDYGLWVGLDSSFSHRTEYAISVDCENKKYIILHLPASGDPIYRMAVMYQLFRRYPDAIFLGDMNSTGVIPSEFEGGVRPRHLDIMNRNTPQLRYRRLYNQMKLAKSIMNNAYIEQEMLSQLVSQMGFVYSNVGPTHFARAGVITISNALDRVIMPNFLSILNQSTLTPVQEFDHVPVLTRFAV